MDGSEHLVRRRIVLALEKLRGGGERLEQCHRLSQDLPVLKRKPIVPKAIGSCGIADIIQQERLLVDTQRICHRMCASPARFHVLGQPALRHTRRPLTGMKALAFLAQDSKNTDTIIYYIENVEMRNIMVAVPTRPTRLVCQEK